MITADNIKANGALASLTDEQTNAIIELAKNSEDAAVSAKAAEVERGFLESVKGKAEVKEGEKATDFIARFVTESNDKLTAVTKERDNNAKEIERLNKVVAEGGNNEEMAKKYEQAKKDISALTKQYQTLQSDFTAKDAKHAKELEDVKVDFIFSNAKVGIKFKEGLADSAVDALTRQAVERVKNISHEFVDVDGNKVLVFKSEDGAIMRNKDNNLNYSTAADLLKAELKSFGILAEDKPNGGGTQPPKAGDTVSLTGAKTRVEAMDIIKKTLCARGLVYGSAEYQAEADKLYTDNNLNKLPFN